MNTTKLENVTYKICSNCEENKNSDNFYKRGLICCECNNSKRRQKYKYNEEYIYNWILYNIYYISYLQKL